MYRKLVWWIIAGLLVVGLGALSASAQCDGRKWALLVGVSNYENPDMSSVPYAAVDIKSVSATLTAYAGYSADNVFVMTSDLKSGSNRPTNLNVFKRLDALGRLMRPDDTLLVYFSCHGFNRNGRHYLATVNTDPASTETLELSSVPLEMLSAKMAKLQAKQLVFVVDACRNDPVRGKGDQDNIRTSDFSKGIMLAATTSGGNVGGAAVLFACSEGERAYEWPEKQHGVFTYYLVQGLKGLAAEPDGELTITSLAAYIQERVARWAAERSKKQTPDLRLQGSAKMLLARFQRPASKTASTGGVVKLRSTIAKLRVRTNPPGAEVFVNGKALPGRTTPCELAFDLEIAKSRQMDVGAQLAGYKTVLAEVTLERGKTTSINLALKKTPKGSAVVTVSPKAKTPAKPSPKPAATTPPKPTPAPLPNSSTTRLAMALPNPPASPPLATQNMYQLSSSYPTHTSTVTSVDFSSDCSTLASGSCGGAVVLRDMRSGRETRTMFDRGHTVSSLCFSPDGKLLVAAGSDGTMNIWRVRDGVLLTTCKGHSGPVTCVRFSPDSSKLVTGGLDSSVRIWDVDTGLCRRLLSGHMRGVLSVDISPDGSTLASGSDDGVVKLWEAATGREKPSSISHPGAVSSVRFSPNGKLLATGGYDCAVRLWETGNSRLLREMSTGDAWVFDLCFSPDGSRVIAAAGDKSIRAWDTTTGAELRPLLQESGVKSVAISPDGSTLAAGGVDGSLTIWRGN